MKNRLYVDEVGNSDLGSSRDPNHRYLSLTGAVIELGHVDTVVHPPNFGGQIAAVLEQSKYNRNSPGQVKGWGAKWLP